MDSRRDDEASRPAWRALRRPRQYASWELPAWITSRPSILSHSQCNCGPIPSVARARAFNLSTFLASQPAGHDFICPLDSQRRYVFTVARLLRQTFLRELVVS